MVDILNIYRYCPNCKGTGKLPVGGYGSEVPAGEVTCSFCGGDGERLWGQMREEEPDDE